MENKKDNNFFDNPSLLIIFSFIAIIISGIINVVTGIPYLLLLLISVILLFCLVFVFELTKKYLINIILQIDNCIYRQRLNLKLNRLKNISMENPQKNISSRITIEGPFSIAELYKVINELKKYHNEQEEIDRERIKSGIYIKRFFGLRNEKNNSILVYSVIDRFFGVSTRWENEEYKKIVKYNNKYYFENYYYDYRDIN
jgi:ABC-type multidrug transport system fused ATPase/permease subunit